MDRKAFDKHYSRFQKHSLLKSILCGTIAGFLAAVISAACFWFFGVNAFWVSIVVFLAATAVCGLILFKTKLKPKARDMAHTLDKLGLDERMITMAELEGSQTFMAKLQREDATKASQKVDTNLIKFAVSIPLVAAICFTLLLSGGMITVNALSSAGVIRSGVQIIEDVNTVPDVYYNVNYVISGSGVIMGNESQTVKEGEDGTAVMAVADYGYAFVRWSDGNTSPYRVDLDITDDILLTAVFENVTNLNDFDDLKDGTAVPVDPEAQEDMGDMYPPLDPPQEGETPREDENNNNSGASSDPFPNTVLDGETDYGGKIYSDYVSEAVDRVTSDPTISDDEKSVIDNYFNNIKR